MTNWILPVVIVLALLADACSSTWIDPEEYALRRAEMLSLENNVLEAMMVKAYNGEAIDEGLIDSNLLFDLDQDRDAAFRMIMLVRLHELSSDRAIQRKIFEGVKTIPFWISYQESIRVYWTENQMSMWMSSAQIFYERYPDDADLFVGDNLKQRLLHYLNQKLEYGFAEFFSSVYLRYTLSGLLNLSDFSQDPDIQPLATQVAYKLIDHILTGTNSEGAFPVAAGRNYIYYYLSTAHQMSDIIWILTGRGEKPNKIQSTTGILITSDLDFASITLSYNSDSIPGATIAIGPSLSESFESNKGLSLVDRVIFQWSYGAYFHPDVSDDTILLFDQLDLWNHGEFAAFKAFKDISGLVGDLGELLAPVTASSVLTGHDVVLFKNREVVLSSVQNYFPGSLGYQSYPWVASTGKLSIWTQSGPAVDWEERPGVPSNSHLPYLEQIDNVLLIMYNPKDALDLVTTFVPNNPLGLENKEVALHWPDSLQGVGSYGLWKCGYEEPDGGYICVRNDCLGLTTTDSGIEYCSEEYQTWAAIVGNGLMYGSFENFTKKVQEEAVFKSEWISPERWCFWCGTDYYGEIQFEGKVISHLLHKD